MTEISLGNSSVLLALFVAPMIITLFPTLIGVLQDEFPSQVKHGNPFYILFSPYLDRKGIERKESSAEIMKRSIKVGTERIADRVTSPVIATLSSIQRAISISLEAVREGINRALTVPMRGMFSMVTGVSRSLNVILDSVLGSVQGLFNKIRSVVFELAGMAVTALNLQMVAINTLYASIGFFMFLLRILGGVVIALGIPMMFSIFLIPLAILLITLGSIMVNISINSQAVLPRDERIKAR